MALVRGTLNPTNGICILLLFLTLSQLHFFHVQQDAGTKIYHIVGLPSASSRVGFEDVVV